MPIHLLHSLFDTDSLQTSLMRSKRVHRSATALSRSSTLSIFPRSSPFDTLPLELQIEIFSLCAPPFPHLSDVNEAPLLLTRVCKSWRTLVSSTPRLWAAFEVEVTGSGARTAAAPPTRDVDTIKDMKRWLNMSKSFPLTTRITHLPVGRSPDLRSAQLVGLLIPEAHRWRHVEFVLPALSMSALQQSLPRETPSLRSLSLQLNGAASTDAPFDLSKLDIPWHQLTTLNLRLEYDNLISLEKCHHILSQTRVLQRCSFDVFCTLENDTEAITLPSLQELHLNLHGKNGTVSTTHSAVRLTTFLNLLDIPSLDSFGVQWLIKEDSAWSQAHPQFTSFLGAVSKTLRSLSLEYLPVSEQQLSQCLSCVPSVTRLDLRFSLSDADGDPITDALLLGCTVPATQPPPSDSSNEGMISPCSIPRIEEINIECHGKQHTPSALTVFIDSRWAGRTARHRPEYATLKSFHVLSMHQPPAVLDKRVKKWLNEGLKISIDSLVVR